MTGSYVQWLQKLLLIFPAAITLGRSKYVFLRMKRQLFHILCRIRRSEPVRSLIQNTSSEAVYLLWGRHAFKFPVFLRWRVLKPLLSSTEQEKSCLLASDWCEWIHRQTLSLQLSSWILIFTLVNPYTKQSSSNDRWWTWEWVNPSTSGSQVLVWDLPCRWATWTFLPHVLNEYYALLGNSEIQLPLSDQKFCHGSEKIPHAVGIFLLLCPGAAGPDERC